MIRSTVFMIAAAMFPTGCGLMGDPIPRDLGVEGLDFAPAETWEDGVAVHRLIQDDGEIVWCTVNRITDGSFFDAATKVVQQSGTSTLEIYAKPAGFESYLREDGDPTWSFEISDPDRDGERVTFSYTDETQPISWEIGEPCPSGWITETPWAD